MTAATHIPQGPPANSYDMEVIRQQLQILSELRAATNDIAQEAETGIEAHLADVDNPHEITVDDTIGGAGVVGDPFTGLFGKCTYIFEDSTERDTFFAANPGLLVTDTVIIIKDTTPPPTPGTRSLDFSKAINSQYLPLLYP